MASSSMFDPEDVSLQATPLLERLHPSVTVLYCSFAPTERLTLASADQQLRWWHCLHLRLETELGRFGAITAERHEGGVCGVLGLEPGEQPRVRHQALRAVQCALAMLDALSQLEQVDLPPGEALDARVGVHTGEVADGLIGCPRLVLRRLLPRRLVGPAVSVAKRLARSAARGAVLASVEAVRGQGHLAHLWRFQEAAQLADGTAVGAYSLPLLAASQYVQLRSPQWPATPQDVCFAAAPLQSASSSLGMQPCAEVVWSAHDGDATWQDAAAAWPAPDIDSVQPDAGCSAEPHAGAQWLADQPQAQPELPELRLLPGAAHGLPRAGWELLGDDSGDDSSEAYSVIESELCAVADPYIMYRAVAWSPRRASLSTDGGSSSKSASPMPHPGGRERALFSHRWTAVTGRQQSVEYAAVLHAAYSLLEEPAQELPPCHSSGSSRSQGRGVAILCAPETEAHKRPVLELAPGRQHWSCVPPDEAASWLQQSAEAAAAAALPCEAVSSDRLEWGFWGSPRHPIPLQQAVDASSTSGSSSLLRTHSAASSAGSTSQGVTLARAAEAHVALAQLPPVVFCMDQPEAQRADPLGSACGASACSPTLAAPWALPAMECCASSSACASRNAPSCSSDKQVQLAALKEPHGAAAWKLNQAAAAAAAKPGYCEADAAQQAAQPGNTCAGLPATLEFPDGAQEAGFRQSWAAQKLPCDCALAAVFLAMAGLREARACILAGAGAYAPDPVDVLVVCLLLAVLYAALARRSWYLRHRSSISLVLRVVRTLANSWHNRQAFLAAQVCPGGSWSSIFLSILFSSSLPSAALSMCEGNLLGVHLLGDAIALAAVLGHFPWLCGYLPSALGQASCAVLLVCQAALALLLATAIQHALEQRVRAAYLRSLRGGPLPPLSAATHEGHPGKGN